MGTWGTGIFQSDYALDVKDTYMDRIRKGEDDESVMNSLIAEYEREGDCNYDDTRYVFWLALAYIQWKTGRLDPMVKERALSCIQDGSELELWKGETETTYRHRKKALADLEEALLSPQRKRTVYRQSSPPGRLRTKSSAQAARSSSSFGFRSFSLLLYSSNSIMTVFSSFGISYIV